MLALLGAALVAATIWREAPAPDFPVSAMTTPTQQFSLQPMRADVQECISAARTKSGLSVTLQKALRVSKPKDLPFQDEFLSPEDARDIVAYYEASTACRISTLDHLLEHAPIYIPLYIDYFVAIDRRTVAMIGRELTWPDAVNEGRSHGLKLTLEVLRIRSDLKEGKIGLFDDVDKHRLQTLRFLSKGTLIARLEGIVPPPPYQECNWQAPNLHCQARVVR